jgi:hypothetical protein
MIGWNCPLRPAGRASGDVRIKLGRSHGTDWSAERMNERCGACFPGGGVPPDLVPARAICRGPGCLSLIASLPTLPNQNQGMPKLGHAKIWHPKTWATSCSLYFGCHNLASNQVLLKTSYLGFGMLSFL